MRVPSVCVVLGGSLLVLVSLIISKIVRNSLLPSKRGNGIFYLKLALHLINSAVLFFDNVDIFLCLVLSCTAYMSFA